MPKLERLMTPRTKAKTKHYIKVEFDDDKDKGIHSITHSSTTHTYTDILHTKHNKTQRNTNNKIHSKGVEDGIGPVDWQLAYRAIAHMRETGPSAAVDTMGYVSIDIYITQYKTIQYNTIQYNTRHAHDTSHTQYNNQ